LFRDQKSLFYKDSNKYYSNKPFVPTNNNNNNNTVIIILNYISGPLREILNEEPNYYYKIRSRESVTHVMDFSSF